MKVPGRAPHVRVGDKLGKKTAVRLAEALPPFDWNELARQAEVNSKIDALDGRLSGEVNALKHEVAAQAEVMRAGFAEIGSRLDAMDQRWADRFEAFSHEMMHRVYGRMFAICGVVVAIVAAIVT